ncbi:hypothetical protein DFQ28_011707 [Apophysomyces sp. BC1034]|nr:hypothetical protein DFQ30_006507 [Apophysomyces sp. BC1015]KAG0168443.1 hypothetical protein DFQ29_010146 [Apophysomyces sp. BC1021]KAG0184142.1 hypothetical protein DFQ28_011707 [Apophysomyces sp. BC1034]
MTTLKTPVFYVSHGGPDLLENQGRPGTFFEWLGNFIQKELKPKAIVVISAHWQGEGRNGVFVDTSKKPKLIYDFYGFPKRYYEYESDHEGSPALAEQVIGLLRNSGIDATGVNYGNDHGVWSPLKRAMESNKDIPVVEVSTFSHEDMPSHIKMGEALAPLRDEGVLIIGSGMIVHNLRLLWSYSDKPSPQFVKDFDKATDKCACELTGDERKKAANALDKHPAFRQSHPTAEHLTPFHVALGAAGDDEGIKLLHDYQSSLSWGSFGFGLPKGIKLPKYGGQATKDEL